ncbi:MAG: alkaline phosphatase family protein [Bacteroidales bacterium]|nr:alkaline phosphatase family protein [Bacteroidales bacterium]
MYNILPLLVYFFVYISCYSQRNYPPDKPKLIVFIIVDQMRYDYITRYNDKLSNKGIKKLIAEGTFCKNTFINYAITETAPGHASIFTGAPPSVHGIVSNEWYDVLKKQRVNCVEDKSVETVGSSSPFGKYSPKNLFTNTIGDQLKLHTLNKSKVISISLKERSAILAGGKSADAAYWYDDQTGCFISSTYYLKSLPKWVESFNQKKLADLYINRLWTLSMPIQEYKESLPDSNKYEKGFKNLYFVFPYDIMFLAYKDLKNKKSIDYSILKYTPFGNTFLLDFAKQCIINESLGSDSYTDILCISLSSTDYIGHIFGPRSVEIEDTYLKLDYDISVFLEFLETELGKENVLIVLTSDHGVGDSPQYLNDNKQPGGIFKQFYALSLLRSFLNAMYGEGEWVLGYSSLQYFLNRNLIEDSKLNLKDFQETVAGFLLQFTGVANAVTSYHMQYNVYTSGQLSLLQKSFNPKRSGDVMILLESGYIEDSNYMYEHNGPYSYNTHVPLIFYGWRIPRSVITRTIEIIDIAPTIANILQIEPPMGACGKVISELGF